MKHYDLCIKCPDIAKSAEMARQLGWAGICVLLPWDAAKPDISKAREIAAGIKDVDVSIGIEIISQKPGQIFCRAESIRKAVEIIAARGGTPELNRSIVECAFVDILTQPETINNENPFNHVLAGLAKKNRVSVAFSLRPMIDSWKGKRAGVFSKLSGIAADVRRGKCNFVLTSGALSEWDLRAPSELESFGRLLGFARPDEGLGGERLAENRKRIFSGKWVMPGVEIE
jgi:ribonuclease P/MRP protein subunit RPP1